MPKVIGVTNEKGGSGKTTSGFHLAFDLKAAGYKVVLVDNDPQKGSLRWKQGYEDQSIVPPVATLENPLTQSDLEVFSEADFIVIDGPPGFGNDPRLRACHDLLNKLSVSDSVDQKGRDYIRSKIRKIFGFDGTITAKLTAIMKLSDLMIIPCLASVQDLEPAFNLIRSLLQPYADQHGKPAYRVLVTDSDEKTQLYREAREYMSYSGIPTFDAWIKHREIYRQAAARGFTVIENRSDPKATEETEKLTDEVLAIFDMERKQ